MKTTAFFDTMKCVTNHEMDCAKNYKTEIQKEEIQKENGNQNAGLKLDFQLFNIDEVFAN